jgi:uncharacterized lipoprotein YddW (UPF0748 family)
VLLYDTKVGERWGHNYQLVDMPIWYRAAQNCEAMIAAGTDPLRLVCEHTHSRGMNFLAHLLLNLVHRPPSRTTDGRQADFTTDNPQWRIGPDPSGRTFGDPDQLSYAHPAVVQRQLAVATELLHEYPTDGIELNFSVAVPLLSRAQVATHTADLTLFVAGVAAAAAAASVAQSGRRKRVVVRVPASLDANSFLGHDLRTWVAMGHVDTVVAVAVECPDFSASVRSLRELTAFCAQHGVPVLAALESTAVEQTPQVRELLPLVLTATTHLLQRLNYATMVDAQSIDSIDTTMVARTHALCPSSPAVQASPAIITRVYPPTTVYIYPRRYTARPSPTHMAPVREGCSSTGIFAQTPPSL